MSVELLGGTVYFRMFESSKIEEMVEFIRTHNLLAPNESLRATGGGAYKYASLFQSALGVSLEKKDEMRSLMTGMNFVAKHVKDAAFRYSDAIGEKQIVNTGNPFPFLVCNIGSGVSLVKATDEHTFQRVTGTCMGGGTLLGLAKLLTNCKSFGELLELSSHGDNRNVDMLVGDMYGGQGAEELGLESDVLASSFARVVDARESDGKLQFRREDIAKSLIYMVAYNIGQIAYLTAKLHNLNRVYFVGNFIRDHLYTMDTITYAVNFWSQGNMEALFLRHDGFLGAIGALLQDEWDSQREQQQDHNEAQ
eukprot:GILK01008149.1.p1 GENE.GILK01008149.1~~GILK01008149.1.p1  ORF type:complete len:308 (-),score=59.23 GILK01008149.1:171-1094(-)